jgi:acetylglutamate kinase
MSKPVTTVKIGGGTAEDASQLHHLSGDLKDLMVDHYVLVVHGGGAEVTRIGRALGFEPRFHEGIRITLG